MKIELSESSIASLIFGDYTEVESVIEEVKEQVGKEKLEHLKKKFRY